MRTSRLDLTGCSPAAATAVKASGVVIQGQPLQDVGALVRASGVPVPALVRAALHFLDAVGRAADDRTRAPGEPPLQIHFDPVKDPALLALTGREPGVIEAQVVAAIQALRQADPRGDLVATLAAEGDAAPLVIAYMTALLVEANSIDAFLTGVQVLRTEDLLRQGAWDA